MTDEDLNWFRWGNARKAWSLQGGVTGNGEIGMYLVSLNQRGVGMGWSSSKIIAVIFVCHGHNKFAPAPGWQDKAPKCHQQSQGQHPGPTPKPGHSQKQHRPRSAPCGHTG